MKVRPFSAAPICWRSWMVRKAAPVKYQPMSPKSQSRKTGCSPPEYWRCTASKLQRTNSLPSASTVSPLVKVRSLISAMKCSGQEIWITVPHSGRDHRRHPAGTSDCEAFSAPAGALGVGIVEDEARSEIVLAPVHDAA